MMKKYFGLKNIDNNSVVTIGSFDGVHLGHQKLIGRIVAMAEEEGIENALITFEPDPEEFIKKKKGILLTDLEEKLLLFEKLGVQNVFIITFDKDFVGVSAADFIQEVAEKLNPRRIIVGKGFRFGSDQKGDHGFLLWTGKEFGFEIEEVALKDLNGKHISSTQIRKHLKKGEVEKANALLGYRYALKGKVGKGSGRAKEIGFPTANIMVDERKMIPERGVYSGKAIFDSGRKKCAIYIGTSPTLKINRLQVEAHIPDSKVELFGERVTLSFEKRIRAEMTFKDENELKKQIQKDLKNL